VKAAAGGGGRGMRVVRSEADLGSALETASTEAAAAFKDGSVYIERFIDKPRHIEIQVLADEYETAFIWVKENARSSAGIKASGRSTIDCVIAPDASGNGEAAVVACKKLGYSSAGTFEFLLDRDNRFYFMEMNTRIQVEHAVTEMVTLADIVRNQIRIAEGERLGYSQDDLMIVGHAIECRINAEILKPLRPRQAASLLSIFRWTRRSG